MKIKVTLEIEADAKEIAEFGKEINTLVKKYSGKVLSKNIGNSLKVPNVYTGPTV